MQSKNIIQWHTRSREGIVKALNANVARGLTHEQIPHIRQKYGKNILESEARFTVLSGIFKQMVAPLSLVLILALLTTIVLAAYTDAFVIAAALCINIIIGVAQEGKSAKVFEKLSESLGTEAVALRDGTKVTLNASELVPGDIVFLEGGHTVPADVRLIKGNNLKINESALTGEWLATGKAPTTLKNENAPLSAQTNMAFMGTVVAQGHGQGIVVATGQDTAFGAIAESSQGARTTKTPLGKSVARLAYTIIIFIAVFIGIIFILNLWRGGTLQETLLLAVAVSVAAMPEGLPAAVTVTLAIAMQSIMKKGGLVKNLLAAETLGATTIIITDKTGTLTKGVMTLNTVHSYNDAQVAESVSGDTLEILKMSVLTSDAFIDGKNEDGSLKVHGRPLEVAIVEGALSAGLRQDELFKSGNKRIAFLQFEASRRYAASLNEYNGKKRLYITGSPEHILSHATHYLKNGKKTKLTQEIRDEFKHVQDTLSAEGKRFTAVAYRESTEGVIPEDIKNPEAGERLGFVFGGLVAFSDSVRPDVAESITTANKAGIQVIMATGDHSSTAAFVAGEVGIKTGSIVLGSSFAKMADEELLLAVHKGSLFARMLPEQKLRLTQVLQDSGEVVAMTGDGVNDAPALVAADIGIAQGSGTDVAKEASDMVLTNGSFSSIITAVREGRRAIDNLRKIIVYLLSTSASEIVLIGGAIAAGLPLPLLPAQILWANIVEEGFMSFPFAFEKAEKGVMSRGPERSINGESLLFKGGFNTMIFFISITTGLILLTLYAVLNHMGTELGELRTIMFAAVSLDSIFLAFSFKNLRKPIWQTNFFSNTYLLGGLCISLTLLLLSLTWSPLMNLLTLVPLTLLDIFFLVLLGFANIMVVEFAKYFFTSKK